MYAGRRRDIGLGSAKLVALAEAREIAALYRKTARAGGDPIAEHRKPTVVVPTFADRNDSERLIDLLFYYGFLGLPDSDGKSTYIYDTQYDMELLKALSRKRGRTATYCVHPAFWPALRIHPPSLGKADEPSLF